MYSFFPPGHPSASCFFDSASRVRRGRLAAGYSPSRCKAEEERAGNPELCQNPISRLPGLFRALCCCPHVLGAVLARGPVAQEVGLSRSGVSHDALWAVELEVVRGRESHREGVFA